MWCSAPGRVPTCYWASGSQAGVGPLRAGCTDPAAGGGQPRTGSGRRWPATTAWSTSRSGPLVAVAAHPRTSPGDIAPAHAPHATDVAGGPQRGLHIETVALNLPRWTNILSLV